MLAKMERPRGPTALRPQVQGRAPGRRRLVLPAKHLRGMPQPAGSPDPETRAAGEKGADTGYSQSSLTQSEHKHMSYFFLEKHNEVNCLPSLSTLSSSGFALQTTFLWSTAEPLPGSPSSLASLWVCDVCACVSACVYEHVRERLQACVCARALEHVSHLSTPPRCPVRGSLCFLGAAVSELAVVALEASGWGL